MRSPGVIYRKYRQLRKRLLYEKICDARKIKHKNCFYGCLLQGLDEYGYSHFTKVCRYNYQKGDLDICTNPAECNAFALKWNKEKVVKEFEKELSDYRIKSRLYPELCAYEWVLDKNLHEAVKEPGFFGKILIRVIEFLENWLKSSNEEQSEVEDSK